MSEEVSLASLASEGSTSSDDRGWLDVEPDEESTTVQSLFDTEMFSSWVDMLNHCKQEHDFDLVAVIDRLQLDFYGAVKLVNFVRKRVPDSEPLPQIISYADIDDDLYLQPVLQNDALIMALDEILEERKYREDNGTAGLTLTRQDLLLQNSELRDEIGSIRSQFENYRLAVQETLDRRWEQELEASVRIDTTEDGQSNSYFESYAFNDIHETMLKDTIRTDAYRDFIYGNKHLFKDKVVLDIGCGTGILSMFCAKAGAAKVIAVDKSDIIVKAIANVFNNGLANVITCLGGAIEDVKLPVDEVDIIVSEWMGYCLLYEAMLPSILYARDRYLRPGGLLIPNSATLWIAPVADSEFVSEHISFWGDVYGFDMKAMQDGIFDEIKIESLPASSVCGKAFPFKTFNMVSVEASDLSFTAEWKSCLDRPIVKFDGFLIWFDIFFATSSDGHMLEPNMTPNVWNATKEGNVAFTTGPFGDITHWKQGLLLMPPKERFEVQHQESSMSGKITFAALEENARALKVDILCSIADNERRSLSWKLK